MRYAANQPAVYTIPPSQPVNISDDPPVAADDTDEADGAVDARLCCWIGLVVAEAAVDAAAAAAGVPPALAAVGEAIALLNGAACRCGCCWCSAATPDEP